MLTNKYPNLLTKIEHIHNEKIELKLLSDLRGLPLFPSLRNNNTNYEGKNGWMTDLGTVGKKPRDFGL